jgi:hypothetical protein
MNTLKRILLAATVALLAACQLPLGGTGTLKVQLPKSGRTLASNGDLIRLQLTRNGAIIPLAGGDFIEKSLSSAGSTVTVDGLAPGGGYALAVSTGTKNSGESFYRTALYKQSDGFEISAGADTAVSVDLTGGESRFTVLEAVDGALHSATQFGGNFYYLSGANLSMNSTTNWFSGYFAALSSSYPGIVATGLDNDGNSLWLNTNKGVSVYSGGFSSLPMIDANGSIYPSVLESGSTTIYSTATPFNAYRFAYYSGAGLSAGLLVGSSTQWQTMDSLLALDSSFKDLIKGQFIRGFASASYYVYLSTSVGTFRIATDLLNSVAPTGPSSINPSTIAANLKNAKDQANLTMLIQPQDTSLVIGPVSTFSDNAVPGTAYAFGGTANGLYSSTVDTVTGAPPGTDGTLTLVPGTQGMNIIQVATYAGTNPNNNAVYTAAYSANTRELLILNNQTVVTKIPAFEGMPSGKVKLVWYVTSSAGNEYLNLAVSGSDATVTLPVAQWVMPS